MKKSIHVLIIDDDQDLLLLMEKFLGKNGYRVSKADTGKKAMELIRSEIPDFIFCDYQLPDSDGNEMIQKIRIFSDSCPIVMITGYAEVQVAVEALKHGAMDYITKPLMPDDLIQIIEKGIQKSIPSNASSSETKRRSEVQFVIGESPASKYLNDQLDIVAPTPLTVLITGETGTGKEYVAREIHARSKRGDKPFIAVDCGALPKEIAGSELFGHVKGAFTGAVKNKKGCFELADGGTLFLDEIGNLSYENQQKLLRVLQERVIRKIGDEKDIFIDVRIVAATNEDMLANVKDSEFREDLYHRLNEFELHLKPLRERKEDIHTYAQVFLDQANDDLDKSVKTISPEVLKHLLMHKWYGNLRELKNIVKRGVLMSRNDTLELNDFPKIFSGDKIISREEHSSVESMDYTLAGAVAEAEKRAILKALEITNSNKSEAAKVLKVDRKTLYNKIQNYNIDA